MDHGLAAHQDVHVSDREGWEATPTGWGQEWSCWCEILNNLYYVQLYELLVYI